MRKFKKHDPWWDGQELSPEKQKLASDTLIGFKITAVVLIVGFITYFVGSQLGWWQRAMDVWAAFP